MKRAKETPQPTEELHAFFFPSAGDAGVTVMAIDQADAEQKLQQLFPSKP